MKKMVERFMGQIKNVANAAFLDSQEKGVVKVPLFDLALVPIGVVFYYFKDFLKIASVYALLICILAFATNFSHTCAITGFASNEYFSCNMSPALYFTFFMLRMLLVMMFIRMWYKCIVHGEKVHLKEMLTIEVADFKMLVAFVVMILLNVMPIISFVILYNRVPNPDWKVESLFFALVSVGFLIPFVSMRFYSLPIFILAKEKMPNLLKVWEKTKGNSIKIIFSITIILIFYAIVMNYLNVFGAYLLENSMLFGSIGLEFIYNVFYVMLFCFFINHCLLQQGLFFAGADEQTSK